MNVQARRKMVETGVLKMGETMERTEKGERTWKRKMNLHDVLILQCVEEKGLRKICGADVSLDRVTYETEVPCGLDAMKPRWADLLIRVKGEASSSRSILVEVKPKLDDIGEAIRQIKFYRKFINSDKCVIVTYGIVPKNVTELLKNEGIDTVTFSGKPNKLVKSVKF